MTDKLKKRLIGIGAVFCVMQQGAIWLSVPRHTKDQRPVMRQITNHIRGGAAHIQGAIVLATALWAIAFAAGADWIVLNGLTHENIYINEGRSMYFVHFPDTGEVINVPKASVPSDGIGFHEDPDQRRALREAWRANNPERERVAARREDMRQRRTRQETAVRQVDNAQPSVQSQRLSMRRGAPSGLRMNNAPPPVTAPAPRSTTGFGRAAMPSRSARQQYGGAGMMMGGAGMTGGAGGAWGRDVTVISNISDMFFNIDDRLVGEAPAEIHTTYLFRRQRVNNTREINQTR